MDRPFPLASAITSPMGTLIEVSCRVVRAAHIYRDPNIYQDVEQFARTYTDRKRATEFADRQKKSPVVKMARVTEVS